MAMRRVRAKPAEIERERSLFRQGVSIGEIVARYEDLGTPRAYRNVCMNLRRCGIKVVDAVDWTRKWTDEEDDALVRLMDERLALEDIAKILFRRTAGVRSRVGALGLLYADPVRKPAEPSLGTVLGLCDVMVAAMSWGVPKGTGEGHWGQ